MSYWSHNEDSDLCYKRKGGILNSKRGVFTTSGISFALLKGEPAYHADGYHFEGVAVVELFRRGDVMNGDTCFLTWFRERRMIVKEAEFLGLTDEILSRMNEA